MLTQIVIIVKTEININKFTRMNGLKRLVGDKHVYINT